MNRGAAPTSKKAVTDSQSIREDRMKRVALLFAALMFLPAFATAQTKMAQGSCCKNLPCKACKKVVRCKKPCRASCFRSIRKACERSQGECLRRCVKPKCNALCKLSCKMRCLSQLGSCVTKSDLRCIPRCCKSKKVCKSGKKRCCNKRKCTKSRCRKKPCRSKSCRCVGSTKCGACQ